MYVYTHTHNIHVYTYIRIHGLKYVGACTSRMHVPRTPQKTILAIQSSLSSCRSVLANGNLCTALVSGQCIYMCRAYMRPCVRSIAYVLERGEGVSRIVTVSRVIAVTLFVSCAYKTGILW